MYYIGIIESSKAVVQSVIGFFLSREGFSVLFICQSLDEFKDLPMHTRKKANILFVEAGSSYHEDFRLIRYLKSINPQYRVCLLQSASYRKEAVFFLDRQQLEPSLELNFSKSIQLHHDPGGEQIKINGHHQDFSPAASPALTTRETEIAELVITGLTSKTIGETLNISTHTVNAHLRKIFSKLSIKNRTELAFKMTNP
jgi:DNA-binding NarL/FixJ family response regulator